jgi:hypothetical protein
MGMTPPVNQGTPVRVNISLNASGKEHVQDLMDMMKNAGLGGAQAVTPAMMPMRMDMEKFRDTVDGPNEMDLSPEEDDQEIIQTLDRDDDGDHDMDDHEIEKKSKEESYANEPDEAYADTELMTKDLSGGINRQKKMFKPAAKGDNPMAVESIKEKLYALLAEKKAKPDFLDMDKDGDKKEPMKKAVADKKKGAVKEESDMKTGEKKKSSTGGTIEKTKTGIKHTAGKNYSGKAADAEKKVKEATKTPSTWTDSKGNKHPATKVKGDKYTGKDAEAAEKNQKQK